MLFQKPISMQAKGTRITRSIRQIRTRADRQMRVRRRGCDTGAEEGQYGAPAGVGFGLVAGNRRRRPPATAAAAGQGRGRRPKRKPRKCGSVHGESELGGPRRGPQGRHSHKLLLENSSRASSSESARARKLAAQHGPACCCCRTKCRPSRRCQYRATVLVASDSPADTPRSRSRTVFRGLFFYTKSSFVSLGFFISCTNALLANIKNIVSRCTSKL